MDKEPENEIKDSLYTKYLGKTVEVKIDRPLGSTHPKHGDIVYPINYGFVPDTTAGDGEEIDAYVLGVSEPVESFSGKCIAVVHRFDDNEDKLVLAPEGNIYTEEEIRAAIHFQDQFFKSDIIMDI
jgi:inorganic pyrophosphatase